MNALTLVPALALGAALFVPSAEARDHSSHRGGDRGQSSFSRRSRDDSPRYSSSRDRGDSRAYRGESRRSSYDSRYRSSHSYRDRSSYGRGYTYRPRYRGYWNAPSYSYSSYYDNCFSDGYYDDNCRDYYSGYDSSYYVAPPPLVRRYHRGLRPRVSVRLGF